MLRRALEGEGWYRERLILYSFYTYLVTSKPSVVACIQSKVIDFSLSSSSILALNRRSSESFGSMAICCVKALNELISRRICTSIIPVMTTIFRVTLCRFSLRISRLIMTTCDKPHLSGPINATGLHKEHFIFPFGAIAREGSRFCSTLNKKEDLRQFLILFERIKKCSRLFLVVKFGSMSKTYYREDPIPIRLTQTEY